MRHKEIIITLKDRSLGLALPDGAGAETIKNEQGVVTAMRFDGRFNMSVLPEGITLTHPKGLVFYPMHMISSVRAVSA